MSNADQVWSLRPMALTERGGAYMSVDRCKITVHGDAPPHCGEIIGKDMLRASASGGTRGA
jgi:hypothetical protein